MRCTSPLWRINKDYVETFGKDFPKVFRKKVIGQHDYYHYVDFVGVPQIIFQQIPCGQCLSCRINKAREWAERCYLESTLYKSNYFITLTYSDEFLPKNDRGVATLKKRDLTLFWKRLRKWCDSNGCNSFRYFAVGEYGGETRRPHYHCILFDLTLDDLLPYKTVRRGRDVYIYMISPILEKIWGKGFAVITKVVPETCAYTAQYSLKKVGMKYSFDYACKILCDECSNEEKLFNALCSVGDIVAPFNVQSKGLGRAFCKNHLEEILETDRIPSAKVHHIRYFDKLMERASPDRLADIKDLRAAACDAIKRVNVYNAIKQSEVDDAALKRRVKTKRGL